MRCAPPHAVGRGSSPPTPRQVGGCGFETPYVKVSVPLRSARAHFVTWIISRPPTKHALRAADLALLSARPTRDTLHPTTLAEALLYRHRAMSSSAAWERHNQRCLIRGVRPARASSYEEPAARPQCTCALRTWRGCLCGQLATRSSPRHWPRLFSTDTAPGQRTRLLNVVIKGF